MQHPEQPVQNSILCSILFIRSTSCLKKSTVLYCNSEVPRVMLLMKKKIETGIKLSRSL